MQEEEEEGKTEDDGGEHTYLCTCWSEVVPVKVGTSPARPC